jgi:hypothetical protein
VVAKQCIVTGGAGQGKEREIEKRDEHVLINCNRKSEKKEKRSRGGDCGQFLSQQLRKPERYRRIKKGKTKAFTRNRKMASNEKKKKMLECGITPLIRPWVPTHHRRHQMRIRCPSERKIVVGVG